LDEPEISLHIEWQMKFISTLQKLNPNCQLLISTHSPGIFGQGWGSRLTFMEDLFN
jgi:predicted ATP-dependent endonuclease of OLD family